MVDFRISGGPYGLTTERPLYKMYIRLHESTPKNIAFSWPTTWIIKPFENRLKREYEKHGQS